MKKSLLGLAALAVLGLVGCGSPSATGPDTDVGKGPMTSPRPAPNAGGESARPAPSQTGINEG